METGSKNVIQIENVSKIFPNGKKALNAVSLNVKRGEFVVIAGRNGSGKSVLMSLIAGLDEPSSGRINVPENSTGLVFQDADSQILGETPEEDIAFGLRAKGLKKNEISEITADILKKSGLYEKRRFPAREMSGGEKRRLAVAGILALNRDIIIFDEPFANLDYPGVCQVCAIVSELKEEGKTVIVLTHELEKILALADRFVILDQGEIKFNGTPQEGLTQNLEAFGIRNPLARYSQVTDLFWGKTESSIGAQNEI